MTTRPRGAPGALLQFRRLPALIVILLTSFALRAWRLGDANVWWDEGLAIWAVRLNWLDMTLWTAADVHPPIYFWLLKASVTLAGETEYAARFVSVLCGMVTVAALYALGRTLLQPRMALLGATLLAISRFHVWWSQEMRMYIVATMWGVLSLVALVRWFRREGWLQDPFARDRPVELGPVTFVQAALPFVMTTVAGLYSLYLFVTVILIENLVFLSVWLDQPRHQRRRCLSRWLVSQVAIVALFVPWLLLALSRMRSWSVATPFDLRVFVQLYATLLTTGISTYIERYIWLVVPFFAILATALLLQRYSRRSGELLKSQLTLDAPRLVLFTGFLVVPLLVVYVLTQPRGLFYAPRVEARYLVVFAPVFYLFLAWSLTTLAERARWVGLASLAFVTAVFVWTLPGHYQDRHLRDEHQTMVRVIAAYAQPGDAVLLVAGSREPIFGYYYGRLPSGPERPPLIPLPRYALQVSLDNVERELADLAALHPRLWLAEVNAPLQDPDGLVASWLDARYDRLLSYGFAHNALTLFGPPGTPVAMTAGNLRPQCEVSIRLGDEGQLQGFDLPTDHFSPGDVAYLGLYYRADQATPITLELVDEKGRVLEQRHEILPPASPIGRQPFEFRVRSHTPAGHYHFVIHSVKSDQPSSFGNLNIVSTQRLPSAPLAPTAPLAHLANGVELLGYQLFDKTGRPVEVLPGDEALTLELYWRARQKVSRDYTVFAHLVGQAYNPLTAGPVWAGHDSQPVSEGYPTSQWFVDQVVVDRHPLVWDPSAPEGDYELEVGMYLLETMERVPIVDGDGAREIILGRFPLLRP